MSAATLAWRRDVALAAHQVRYEQRSFWRNRRRSISNIAFPLMFLVVFGGLQHGERIGARHDLPFIDFYVPGIVAYSIMVLAFGNLAIAVAAARTNGLLKRLRPTPLPDWAYVVGIVGSTLLAVAIASALLLAIGVAGYGAHLRLATLPGLLLTAVLGTVAFATLAIGISARISSPDSAAPLLAIVTLPMSFISDVFFPLTGAPHWLTDVARSLPLRPLADGLAAAFDPRTHGAGLQGADLRTLAIWCIIGGVMMVRSLGALSARD
ncbi:MAG TPA: ABC transporter permease [Solirubrobacteraceae bacterium]|nr:ABC transporter permease [Solirubrobacteraceae bacterium]